MIAFPSIYMNGLDERSRICMKLMNVEKYMNGYNVVKGMNIRISARKLCVSSRKDQGKLNQNAEHRK